MLTTWRYDMGFDSYSPQYKPTILIMDGNFLIRRAMYAPSTRELSNKQGMPTGAIYSFFNSLRSTIQSIQCNSVIIGWDGGHSERREAIYPQYKERVVDPNEPVDNFGMTDYQYFSHQLSWIEKILECYGVPQVRVSGKEGDDTIYQITRLLNGNKILVTEDGDYVSLIRDDVAVYRPIKKEYIDLGNFETVTGYKTPRHFLYAKSILGDGSDNIPSVAKGVGDGTVKAILSNIEKEEDVTTARVLKEAASFKKSRFDKLVVAGEAPINRNLDLIDISKESFDIFQLKSIIDILEKKVYPNLQMANKLFSVLDFSEDTSRGITYNLNRMSEFSLSPLVNTGYLKEVAMNGTSIIGGTN